MKRPRQMPVDGTEPANQGARLQNWSPDTLQIQGPVWTKVKPKLRVGISCNF